VSFGGMDITYQSLVLATSQPGSAFTQSQYDGILVRLSDVFLPASLCASSACALHLLVGRTAKLRARTQGTQANAPIGPCDSCSQPPSLRPPSCMRTALPSTGATTTTSKHIRISSWPSHAKQPSQLAGFGLPSHLRRRPRAALHEPSRPEASKLLRLLLLAQQRLQPRSRRRACPRRCRHGALHGRADVGRSLAGNVLAVRGAGGVAVGWVRGRLSRRLPGDRGHGCAAMQARRFAGARVQHA
jgi:hypothetical protein